MRREGHIIEEVVEYSNMAESFDQVLSGTKRKKSRQGRYLIAHREEVIKELSERIASGTFHVTAKDIEEKDIIEAGKLRHIQFFKKLKNSIAVHAIMSVVDKHLKKRFIRTTSASIKDRGMHDLMKYIRRDMQEDPEGTRCLLQVRHLQVLRECQPGLRYVQCASGIQRQEAHSHA